MKASTFSKLAAVKLFLLSAVLFSCKKTEVANTDIAAQNLKSDKIIKEVVFSGSLEMSKSISQLSPDESFQRVLIPIKTGNNKLHKYYLIENDLKQKLSRYTYVISKLPVDNKDELFSINFEEKGVTAYNNQLNNKKGYSSKLLVKHDSNELDLNNTFDKEGETPNVVNPAGSGYCIDHWWITWDTETGYIISIEYIGADCYGCMVTGNCEPGGGGGGSNGEQPPSCSQILENFVNQGHAVSVKLAEVDVYNTGTEWKKQYPWKIFEAGLYMVMSTEVGTLEKKPYKTNLGNTLHRWEFMNFEHKNTNAIGISAGGSREVKDVTATPNITPTRLTASMELTFTIENKILGIGGGCSIPLTYTESCNWTAPGNNIVIVSKK